MEENDDEYENLGIVYYIENKAIGEQISFKTRKERSEYLRVNNLLEEEYEIGLVHVPEPLWEENLTPLPKNNNSNDTY